MKKFSKLKPTKSRSNKKGVKSLDVAYKAFNESIELQIAKEEKIQNNKDNENIWTLRQALQGDSHFQTACGYFYYTGFWSGHIETDAPSPPQNFNKAFNWFLLAANNLGEHEAQFYLGEMYELGRGTAQDWESALFWYELSAENGNEKAIERLKRYQKS